MGQAVDHVAEQAHALVGAAQHQFPSAHVPGLLPRDVGPQALDIRVARLAMAKREGGVPLLGDHPVGAFLRAELVGKGDQAAHAGGQLDPVDRGAVALGVQVEARAGQAPLLLCDAAQQAAHEADAGLVERPHAREAHDGVGRAQLKGRILGERYRGHVNPPSRQAGAGPKERSKKASQLLPMTPATSSAEKPAALSPWAMLAKSRLPANQSGCFGKPACWALPSP